MWKKRRQVIEADLDEGLRDLSGEDQGGLVGEEEQALFSSAEGPHQVWSQPTTKQVRAQQRAEEAKKNQAMERKAHKRRYVCGSVSVCVCMCTCACERFLFFSP